MRSTLLAAAAALSSGFYLPGVSPKEYKDGDRVEVKVNKLSSSVTQLPYNYYTMPFCKPNVDIVNAVENLGEVLHGSVIQNSPYDLQMGKPDFKVLCKKDLAKNEARMIAQRIKEDYRVHLIMDNLPAATRMISELPDGKVVTMYDRGYRLGFMGAKEFLGTKPGVPYLNNHLRFIIKYHKDEAFEGARIVGFEVEAFSVRHTYKGTWGKDAQLTSVPLSPDLPPQRADEPGEYIFTYDVTWESSEIRWASRWDLYLYMGDDQIHWFSIINSLAIVLLLTGIVAMIMMRTLRRDFNRYNEQDKEDLQAAPRGQNGAVAAWTHTVAARQPPQEGGCSPPGRRRSLAPTLTFTPTQEESGWKLVHADVFRPPSFPICLVASLGTGMQLLAMACIAIFCAMLGFLSPANRGGARPVPSCTVHRACASCMCIVHVHRACAPCTVHQTVHGTVHQTVHGTVHQTVHGTVHHTVHGTVHHLAHRPSQACSPRPSCSSRSWACPPATSRRTRTSRSRAPSGRRPPS